LVSVIIYKAKLNSRFGLWALGFGFDRATQKTFKNPLDDEEGYDFSEIKDQWSNNEWRTGIY